jgi:PAS domain S-box-containing protein
MNVFQSIQNLLFPKGKESSEQTIKDEIFDLFNTKLSIIYCKVKRFPANSIVFISQGIFNLVGYIPDEFYENPDLLKSIIHHEDLRKYLSFLDYPAGTKAIFHFRVYHKNGSVKWVEIHSIFSKETVSSILYDITEKSLDESKIQKSEERLLFAMETTGIAIWEWDMESSHLIWKTPPENLLGIPKGTLNESIRSYFHLIHPDDLKHFVDTITIAVKNNDHYNTEHRIIDSSGNTRWVEAYAQIFREPNSNSIRWLGTLRDITERKNLISTIQDSEIRTRTLVESSVDGIFVVTKSGIIVEWNRVMEKATKILKKDSLGKYAWDVLTHVFSRTILIGLENLTLEDKIHELLSLEQFPDKGLKYDFVVKDKFQNQFFFQTHHFQIKYSGQNFIVTYVRDLTELKKFELETKNLYQRTKNQSQAIIELASDEYFNNGYIDYSFKKILSIGTSVIGSERASIWMYRENFSILDSVYEFNSEQIEYKMGRYLLDASQIPNFTASLLSSRVIVSNSIETDTRMVEFNKIYSIPNKIKSIMIASIRVKGKIIGILCIESLRKNRGWKSDEIMFAGLLSDQTAIAIINSERKQNEDQVKVLNQNLEKIVNERTAQLRSTNTDLSKTLTNLSKAQNQLIQSEKMAALGQLIAGIAHEINNPIGSIKASLELIRSNLKQKSLSDLNIPTFLYKIDTVDLALADSFIQVCIQVNQTYTGILRRQMKNQLQVFFKNMGIIKSEELADKFIDIGIASFHEKFFPLFLKSYTEDFLFFLAKLIFEEKNFQGIESSLQRVANIILSLKTYSHNDKKGEKILFNIKDSIETVLTILQTKLQKNIEVIKNFEDTPDLSCYPDDLIQVWTNLIMNSAQAMNFKGTIEISLNYNKNKNSLQVIIADSGPGIPFEIRDKIFQPFFTTKKLGEGTGLGLDICSKIISNHGGTIWLEPNSEKTTFIIELPITHY